MRCFEPAVGICSDARPIALLLGVAWRGEADHMRIAFTIIIMVFIRGGGWIRQAFIAMTYPVLVPRGSPHQ